MNKMMNPEMEVVRFGAEDVIATSGGPLMKANYSFEPLAEEGKYKGVITFYDGNAEIGTLGFNNKGTGGVWQYAGTNGGAGGAWTPTSETGHGDKKFVELMGTQGVSGPTDANDGRTVFTWFYDGLGGVGGFAYNEDTDLFWYGTYWSH